MKNFRKVCRGEKGFTLIELLVVIIILGVLAAVVTLAVTRFIGKGVLESANAELVTLQTAIESALAEGNSGDFTVGSGAVAGWDGTVRADGPWIDMNNNATLDGPTVDVAVYDQLRTHRFKAEYDIDADGTVSLGDETIVKGWGDTKIDWCAASGGWVKAGAACP